MNFLCCSLSQYLVSMYICSVLFLFFIFAILLAFELNCLSMAGNDMRGMCSQCKENIGKSSKFVFYIYKHNTYAHTNTHSICLVASFASKDIAYNVISILKGFSHQLEKSFSYDSQENKCFLYVLVYIYFVGLIYGLIQVRKFSALESFPCHMQIAKNILLDSLIFS